MIHSVDPRQNRLFDPFDGVIPPLGRRIIADGWQGVFRHVILQVMPVAELGSHFSDSMGAPTKELYSMAGLVFLADFFDWTPRRPSKPTSSAPTSSTLSTSSRALRSAPAHSNAT
jgi:hypothetical protein